MTTPSTVVVAASTPTANGTWERYLVGESVTCVTRHGAEIWAGTANGQVVHLDTTNGKQIRYTLGEVSPTPVSGLTVDAEGRVWAATLGQGVFVLAAMDTGNGPSQRVYTAVNAGLSSKAVHALIVNAAGTVWCGTADGFVNRLIPEGTGDGNVWQSFAVPDAGPGTPVTALAADAADTLWVGVRGRYLTETATYSGGGLYRLRIGDTPTWKKILSDNVGVVEAIFVRPDGRKWVATSPTGAEDSPSARGGGVVVWDGKDWTLFEALGAGMPSRRVTSVAVDARERTWIGTDKGLVVYEGTERTVYQASKSGLASDNVRAIVLDENGSAWLATEAGLCRLAGR
jgi:ligand-binding sensor domain-containing protein